MAEKNVILKDGADTLYPKTKAELVEGLPQPTSADNGKMLGVDDGAYALVEGGGGGGSLYVHHMQVNDNSRKITVYFSVITSNATPFTYSTFGAYLKDNGMIMGAGSNLFQNNHLIIATGLANVAGNQTIFAITGNSNGEILAVPYQNTYGTNTSYSTSGGTLFDNVIQIV